MGLEGGSLVTWATSQMLFDPFLPTGEPWGFEVDPNWEDPDDEVLEEDVSAVPDLLADADLEVIDADDEWDSTSDQE